jgi:hypothetical protein
MRTRIWDPRSEKQDPTSGKNLFWFSDPGVKKGIQFRIRNNNNNIDLQNPNKKNHKTERITVYRTISLVDRWKKDPDPHLWLMDSDPDPERCKKDWQWACMYALLTMRSDFFGTRIQGRTQGGCTGCTCIPPPHPPCASPPQPERLVMRKDEAVGNKKKMQVC